MVEDSSAFLAMILREPAALWVRDQLNQAARPIFMSSINYAETLLAAADRRVGSASEIRALFSASGVEIASVTAQLAEIAAQARIAFPLRFSSPRRTLFSNGLAASSANRCRSRTGWLAGRSRASRSSQCIGASRFEGLSIRPGRAIPSRSAGNGWSRPSRGASAAPPPCRIVQAGASHSGRRSCRRDRA